MNNILRINKEKALRLFKKAQLYELGKIADEYRKKLHPEGIVTFVVDRNINYTNVCINKCKFCAYYRDIDSQDAFIINKEQLKQKIQETVNQGGTQILIQGGLHPDIGIDFYINMFKFIKSHFNINIHGLSPPEICYIADKEGLSIKETLLILKNAGIDSIPGGGAEILSDNVRNFISPRKIKTNKWIEVMEQAHKLGIKTTATMMFGSIETPEDIIEHLEIIRNLQDKT